MPQLTVSPSACITSSAPLLQSGSKKFKPALAPLLIPPQDEQQQQQQQQMTAPISAAPNPPVRSFRRQIEVQIVVPR
ncbi:hypothetical protein HK100_007186, partial [Physocladia obscura]